MARPRGDSLERMRLGFVTEDWVRSAALARFCHRKAGEGYNPRAFEQSLAADGAIAFFSSNLFPLSLNADRAPQLKVSVMPLAVFGRKT
jgi:hypothetical protein